MHSVKYEVKLFLQEASQVEFAACIPVFHRWIQAQTLAEVLIDVADYRHVPQGPGVVLVAHDAHYVLETTDGQPGLLYSRRRETHASRQDIHALTDRLASVLHSALSACEQLEAEPALAGLYRFRGDTLLVRCNDRLLGHNTVEAYHDLQQHLAPLLERLYPGQQVKVERLPDAGSRLTVQITATENPEVGTLLARLTPHVAHTNGVAAHV